MLNQHPQVNPAALDAIVLSRSPVAAQSYSNCPHQTQLSANTLGQDVIVTASNGLFLNHANPWMVAQLRIATLDTPYRPPYGTATEFVEMLLPPVPHELTDSVVAHFRQNCPLEAACLISYNWETNTYKLHFPKVISATGSHIKYEYPSLAHGEAVVIDIHSHGQHRAFFSHTDYLDDRGCTKIAVVLGNLDCKDYSVATKVTVKGIQLAQSMVCEILDQLLDF